MDWRSDRRIWWIGGGGLALALLIWVASSMFGPPAPPKSTAPPAVENVWTAASKNDKPKLLNWIKTGTAEEASAAVNAYVQIATPQESRQMLTETLNHQSDSVRATVYANVPKVFKAPEAAPLYTAVASDKSPEAVQSAIKAISALRAWPSQEALNALINQLDSPNIETRRCAIGAIATITGLQFPYNPNGSQAERRAIMQQIKKKIPSAYAHYLKYNSEH